jgi:AcrR family transcriptional regulator
VASRPRGTRQDATVARIVAAARAQLTQGQGVSVRGVAGRLELTPPALYRYVASRDHLLDLVAAAIDIEIEGHVAAAIEIAGGEAGANAPLVVALEAYRSWALANRAEFGLMVQHSGDRAGGSRCGEHLRSVKLVLDLAARGCVLVSGDIDHEARASTRVHLAQVFGVLCLEAFGHVDAWVVARGALFNQVTSQLATEHRRTTFDQMTNSSKTLD